MNNVQFIGRIVKDIELKTLTSGTKIANFSLAVNKRVPDENGETADFFYCTAWKTLAEIIAKFCSKGSKVYIGGELHNRTYETRTGERKQAVEVLVQDCEFLDTKQKQAPQENDDFRMVNEELPF